MQYHDKCRGEPHHLGKSERLSLSLSLSLSRSLRLSQSIVFYGSMPGQSNLSVVPIAPNACSIVSEGS